MHHHQHTKGSAEKALWVAFILNSSFLVIELIVGLIADSLALLSDAGHMISDVAALGLALLTQRIARATSGPSFTFGLRRVPVLGAFGNSISLLVVAALIIWAAMERFQHPHQVMAMPVLVAGSLGLLINLASAWHLQRSGEKNLNVRGAILHLLADALGSVGAIIAAAVIFLFDWYLIDTIISLIIALLMILSTWPLLTETTKVLLQVAPIDIDIDKLRAMLLAEPAVRAINDLHLWQVDVGQSVLSAVLATDKDLLSEIAPLSQHIKNRMWTEFGIRHTTLEWNTNSDCDSDCIFE